MDQQRVKEILEKIKSAKIAVYGDYCLDAYWMLEPGGSEVSLETGLQARAVGRQRYSLGGAANIVANLAALKPAAIKVIGVVGDDIFGRELARQLEGLAVDITTLIVQEGDFDTVTFGKPYLAEQEQAGLMERLLGLRIWQLHTMVLQASGNMHLTARNYPMVITLSSLRRLTSTAPI